MARSAKPRSSRPAASQRDVTYPIRAVSLMTGVSIDTLRAWERRYGAVTPVRDDRGRVYTDADVQRIRLLRDAVANGHPIGRVAKMTDAHLREVAARATDASAGPAGGGQVAVAHIGVMIAALERFDAAAVETELARAAALLRPAELLRDVLVPVLTEVGERWHRGDGRIAHEHMLSASVRNVLGSLLRVHQKAGVPDRILFATPSGERHEFGTLGAAMLAASGGLGTIYLGPDLPSDDIVEVASVVGLDVVALGIGDGAAGGEVEHELDQIATRLDPRIELWLGGRGADRGAKRLRGRAVAVPSYTELEQQLVRIGAKF